MRHALLCLLLSLGLCLPVQAREVAGVQLPETRQAGETVLLLNGAGVRTRFLFEVYVAALYLPVRQARAEAILDAPPPRRLQLSMLRDVSADAFGKALRKGLKANLDAARLARLEPRIAEFESLIARLGEAGRGTTYVLDETAAGMQLLVNGKPAGKPIAGTDFFTALLSVWLGQAPTQDDLKRALLGG